MLTIIHNHQICARTGSIRRECLDHLIIIGEDRLRRILRDYLDSSSPGWNFRYEQGHSVSNFRMSARILHNRSCKPLTSRCAVADAMPQFKQPMSLYQQSLAEKSRSIYLGCGRLGSERSFWSASRTVWKSEVRDDLNSVFPPLYC